MSISREEAIAAARRAAEERGWRWEEPVQVCRRRAFIGFGRVVYEVSTNADNRGCNARFLIDGEDGMLREAYWLPR